MNIFEDLKKHISSEKLTKKQNKVTALFISVFLFFLGMELTSPPSRLWLLVLLGGTIDLYGIIKEKRYFIYTGFALVSVAILLNNTNQILALESISFFIGIFILFYSAAVFVDELIGRDILVNEGEVRSDESWDRYKKYWTISLVKYISLSFFISFFISVFVFHASIDFSVYQDETISFLGAFGSGILGFILIYLLISKLPDQYDPK